jgi:hypothetical protein
LRKSPFQPKKKSWKWGALKMSKLPQAKNVKAARAFSHLPPEKYVQKSNHLVLQKEPGQSPAVRPGQILVAYKDLNQEAQNQLKIQKQQFLFALGVFTLLGALLLAMQVINNPRKLASEVSEIKVEAKPLTFKPDQYEKSCYKGENGKQICLTRTSRK